MPEHQSLPFFVDEISGSRAPPDPDGRPRVDDRKVNLGAPAQADALFGRVRARIRKNRLRQRAPFRPLAEGQDGGFDWTTVFARPDSGKAAHRLAVAKAFVGHRIAEGIPVLLEIHPAHRLGPTLGIMRCDQRQKTTLRHHNIHPCRKQCPPRSLHHRIAKTDKGGLFRHRHGSFMGRPSLPDHADSNRFFRHSPTYPAGYGLPGRCRHRLPGSYSAIILVLWLASGRMVAGAGSSARSPLTTTSIAANALSGM